MPLATEADACREYARNVGREDPTREWICTPFDTWERNPHYTGPRGRHPEDDQGMHEEGQAAPAPGPDVPLPSAGLDDWMPF